MSAYREWLLKKLSTMKLAKIRLRQDDYKRLCRMLDIFYPQNLAVWNENRVSQQPPKYFNN
jgi:hypothetical protein